MRGRRTPPNSGNFILNAWLQPFGAAASNGVGLNKVSQITQFKTKPTKNKKTPQTHKPVASALVY